MAQIYTIGTAGPNAGSPAGTYGMTFVVNSGADLSLTSVGLFDYGVYGVGVGTINLWKDGDVTPTFSTTIDLDAQGTAAFDYIMKSITPVALQAGFEYALVWQNSTGSSFQPYANGGVSQNSTGVYSKITPTHVFNFTGTPFDTNPLNTISALSTYSVPYASVNMILIDNSAVPEPSEYAAVAGLGLVAFAAFRKFRR
jgi:hypothetical protein